LPVRALISCAALLAAAALAPGALASGIAADPDPNPDPAQPQPDAYQTAPVATTPAATTPAATTPAAAAPAKTVAQTPAPVLPTVHISTPRTQLPSPPPKVHVHPVVVVATPTHVSEAVSQPPATESTPRPAATHIAVPAPVAPRPSTKLRPRPAHVGREPRQAAHHARATAPRTPTISFARSVLDLRWWHVVRVPSVEVARPRQVSPGVALAVAAVVLLSGSFLVVAARQVRRQVGP
jgi:subtilase-type serine protease